MRQVPQIALSRILKIVIDSFILFSILIFWRVQAILSYFSIFGFEWPLNAIASIFFEQCCFSSKWVDIALGASGHLHDIIAKFIVSKTYDAQNWALIASLRDRFNDCHSINGVIRLNLTKVVNGIEIWANCQRFLLSTVSSTIFLRALRQCCSVHWSPPFYSLCVFVWTRTILAHFQIAAKLINF